MFPHTPLRRNFEAALRDSQNPKLKVRIGGVRDLPRHVEGNRKQVLKCLSEALGDPEPDVRTAAAIALADCEAHEAVLPLIDAAADEHPEVRQMALAALGELADPRGLEPVREALSDPAPALRFQAVMAFPRICQQRKEAIEVLLAATEDDDPLVCHIALRMAEELGPEQNEQSGPENGEKGWAGEQRAVVAPALLERAEQLLEDPSDIVRIASAIILTRSGREQCHSILVDVAHGALRTDQAEDEAAAIELCGQLGLREAIPGLLRRAKGSLLRWRQDRFAWQARVALAAMDYDWAVDSIVRELRSLSRERRTLAVVAAGSAGIRSAAPVIEAMQGKPEQADPEAVREALATLAAPRGPNR